MAAFQCFFLVSKDALQLKELTKIEFETHRNWNIYWDDIPLFLYKEKFRLAIRKIRMGDITEIDSYEELIKVDKSYRNYEKRSEV